MFADELIRLEEHIESLSEDEIICYVRSNEYELNEVKQDIISSCVKNVKVIDNILYINKNAKIYFYTLDELSENVFILTINIVYCNKMKIKGEIYERGNIALF